MYCALYCLESARNDALRTPFHCPYLSIRAATLIAVVQLPHFPPHPAPMSQTEVTMYHCLPIPRGDWKDIFEMNSIQMVVLHNIFIRGFNAMLYYSGEVQPGTKKFTSFLGYCATVNHYLHHHHHLEETFWFPFLEERLGNESMVHNRDAHEEIMGKFAVFDNMVKALQADQSKFNLTEFREAIRNFMPRLLEHLASEPDTFRGPVLRQHITKEDLLAHEEVTKKEIIASFSLVNDLPIFYVNGDRKNVPWFPPLPALMGFIVKNILYWIHSDIWAFGSTTRQMDVKPQFAEYEPSFEPEARD